MSIISGIADWLRTYDPLSAGKLPIDYLPEDTKNFSVDFTTSVPVVKKYLNGTRKQCDFVLASREFYGTEIAENKRNLEFYEDFSGWVEDRNRSRQLPKLGDGKEALKVEVSSPGYLFYTGDNGTARYQIQLKLIYFEHKHR